MSDYLKAASRLREINDGLNSMSNCNGDEPHLFLAARVLEAVAKAERMEEKPLHSEGYGWFVTTADDLWYPTWLAAVEAVPEAREVGK